MRVHGVFAAIIPDRTDLNRLEDSGLTFKMIGHTTVNVSPIRIVEYFNDFHIARRKTGNWRATERTREFGFVGKNQLITRYFISV